MSEAAITRRLVRSLRDDLGAWVYKVHGTGMSRSGVPDLLCCVDGLMVGIEVKTERGVVSRIQRRELDQITESGGLALVCKGDVDLILEQIEQRAWGLE